MSFIRKKGSRLSGYWMGLNLLCYGAVYQAYLHWFAKDKCLTAAIYCRASTCLIHAAAQASLGILQSPRGERQMEPT